jgi:hypothetical protein
MLATTLKNTLPTNISKKPIDIINLQTTQNPYYAPTGGTSRQEHVSRREEKHPPVWGCALGLRFSREGHD